MMKNWIKGVSNNTLTGGLRKVADVEEPCMSPAHNPPTMILLEPGVYEYTCPNCGKVTRFSVSRTIC